MIALLITLMYSSFISLGFGRVLLGSAWPVMQAELGVPLSYAGIIFMIITGCTIISCLLSDRLIKRFNTWSIALVSALITGAALFGFSLTSSFWLLCVLAFPYGLSSGTLDAAINNYVARHFASRTMNWLHGFWGLGAVISPFIMSYYLVNGFNWSSGYKTAAALQISIALLLFFSFPLFKRPGGANPAEPHLKEQISYPALSLSQIFRIKGVKFIIIALFGYGALEGTTALWASSYLVLIRGISPEIAARYASLFFIGMTSGRFLSGFISNRIGDRNMVRIGIGIIILGILAVWLPVRADWLCLNGFIIIGFGCAPVFPCVLHATPDNFGRENAQAIVGVQMASSFSGGAFVPPLFGLIANNINIALYPVFVLIFLALLLSMTEKLNRQAGSK